MSLPTRPSRCRFQVRTAALALAFVIGSAGLAAADEPAPGASDNVPLPEKPPPDEEPAATASARAEPGSHVHDVQPAPRRSVREALTDIWTRDQLTGDWRGLRTDLHDHGIDIGLRLSQYGQWVASGGVETNGEYGGRMDYRVNVDGKKLLGSWEGLSFNMHAMTRFGDDIGADAGAFALPNTGLLMPLPDDYDGTQITGLTITQSLFHGRADVFFGKLDVIDLVTGFFPQVAYGQEGFWNTNALVTSLPWFGAVRGLSLWGGGAWTVKNEMVQGGFLVTGTENVTTTWEFSDSFDHGVFLAGFYRFFWDLGDMPGYFLIFAGGSTRDQPSDDPHDIVFIPRHGLSDKTENPWDIAGYVYQVFWQAENDPNRKATFFLGGTGGPDDPQFAEWNIFAAVEAYGPMAFRPNDRMGLSGWYSGLSDEFTDLTSDVGIRLRDTWGFELYYNAEISPWLHLTPDLQLVKNENEGDSIAIIPGVRLVIDF